MDNRILQFSFIIGTLCFFGIIVFLLRKNALSLKYTLLWLLSVLLMLIVCIFPEILVSVANVFGFNLVSNAVFSLLLAFIILILLSLTSIVSLQAEKIKTLVQLTALLEKRIRDLEIIQ